MKYPTLSCSIATILQLVLSSLALQSGGGGEYQSSECVVPPFVDTLLMPASFISPGNLDELLMEGRCFLACLDQNPSLLVRFIPISKKLNQKNRDIFIFFTVIAITILHSYQPWGIPSLQGAIYSGTAILLIVLFQTFMYILLAYLSTF